MTEAGRPAPRRLAAARLAAVQALYQCEITGVSADQVIGDFLDRGVGGTAMLTADGDDAPEIEVALAKLDKGELRLDELQARTRELFDAETAKLS